MKQFIFPCVLCILLAGCGQPRPAGFPDVVPCRVAVVKDGKPIDRVVVIFSPASAETGGEWICSGETGADGVAVMNTMWASYSAKGAPETEFKVFLSKEIDIASLSSAEERIAMSEEDMGKLQQDFAAKREAARVIPAVLESAGTTPVKITVSKSSPLHKIELNDYR